MKAAVACLLVGVLAGAGCERGVPSMAQLEDAVRARPGDLTRLEALAEGFARGGRLEEAADVFGRVVGATPSVSALHGRAEERLAQIVGALPSTPAPVHAPNIAVVVIDTLRADHVSAYGYHRATTPILDQLASEGVLFERAVSQAPWTAASVASLLTGLYPSVHGIDGGIEWHGDPSGGRLPFVTQRALIPGQPTLASRLRRHGYRTAGFVSNIYVNAIFGFGHGFEVFDDRHDDYARDVFTAKRRGATTIAAACSWLEGAGAEPFLLFVHLNDPHWPYDPPAGFGDAWTAAYTGDLTPADTGAVVETEGQPGRGLSPADLEYLIGLYDGEIRYADANLGRLLGCLRAHPFTRPVVTVVTADHGEEFLDHGGTSHGYTLYEEQVHVPLVVHTPDRWRPRRIPQLVESIDVLPTLLALAELSDDGVAIQGRSLLAVAQGEDVAERDALSEAPLRGALEALQRGAGLKLIQKPNGRAGQLFDLGSDPREQRNLIEGARAQAVELRGRLDAYRADNAARRAARAIETAAGRSVVVDEATRKRLEALGYDAPPR